jgi:hypothetical protein
MQFDGLHALAAAAEALERTAAHASPDLNTQRERRRLAVHLRRFEEMRRPRRTRPPPAPLVGRILWKEFHDTHGRPRLYQGHVASVSRATKGRPYDFGAGVTATVKYSVQYDDGDSEDMTHADLVKHLID